MNTVTWAPGTKPELDALFDELRERHYNDRSHRLWKNYHKDSFRSVSALTICFDDTGVPEMCSSILARNCWPKGAFRVLNRLWKSNNKISYPRTMSPSWGLSAKSQFEWMQKTLDYKLCFLSRETDNWMMFTQQEFSRQWNINWKIGKHKYLTCPNRDDESCWQHILYIGEETLLKEWEYK